MTLPSVPTGRRPAEAIALLPLLLLVAGAAHANLLLYEPFAYDADTLLDGQAATGQNLTGDYQPIGGFQQQRLSVTSPSLTYGNLIGAPTPSGNRVNDLQGVTASGATASLETDILVNPGDALYWSALFTFDDSSGGNRLANVTLHDDTNDELLVFGEPAVGVRGLQVGATTAALGQFVARALDNAFENGETFLLIGRYVNSATPGADLLELLAYDTAGAVMLPSSFDPMDPNADASLALVPQDIDFGRITSITFRIRGDDNNFIDELRVGSTYASVVPEPGTAALVMLGLSGLAARARTRRLGGR